MRLLPEAVEQCVWYVRAAQGTHDYIRAGRTSELEYADRGARVGKMLLHIVWGRGGYGSCWVCIMSKFKNSNASMIFF